MTVDECQPGMSVTWIHPQRGGYGFAVPVDAIVLRVTAKRAWIAVTLRDGRVVRRLVAPAALRHGASAPAFPAVHNPESIDD